MRMPIFANLGRSAEQSNARPHPGPLPQEREIPAAALERRSDLVAVPAASQSAMQGGFTMVEIAICLAVIAFALVAIIGVLPIGLNAQKENREETVVNFDANYLMDAIRNGAQGLDYLTNYVIVITNSSRLCDSNGVPIPGQKTHVNWYTVTNYSLDGSPKSGPALTNGAVIVGLLSLPKYLSARDANGDIWSNYVSADFRAITGIPTDQGTASSSKDFAFSYRVTVELVPNSGYPYAYGDPTGVANLSVGGNGALDKNGAFSNYWAAARNLQANLNEVRLRFRWPVINTGVLGNSKLGNGSQVFRVSAGGLLTNVPTASTINPNAISPPVTYYYILPQTYAAAP